MAAVRDHRWMFVESTGDHSELYDMEADPMQTRNLAGDPANREQVENNRRRLLQWHLQHCGGFFEPGKAGFWEDQTLFYDEARFCGERIASLDKVVAVN